MCRVRISKERKIFCYRTCARRPWTNNYYCITFKCAFISDLTSFLKIHPILFTWG
eukprot:UN28512